MNAHNERFNRTIQESFADFYEDLLFSDLGLFNRNRYFYFKKIFFGGELG